MSTGKVIIFQLPFALPSLNTQLRTHWAVRQREQAKMATSVIVAIGGPRYRPSEPLQRARVQVKRYSAGELDPDNLAASCKHLLDVLCRASTTHPYGLGFIEDDSPAHLELVVMQAKCSPRKGSTIVSIAPMGASDDP
jgi:hypothetical protein